MEGQQLGTATTTAVKFASVQDFKDTIGANSISIVKNPNTGKLFAAADNGKNYKCAGDLDVSKPIAILIPETGIDDACLINGSNNNIATL